MERDGGYTKENAIAYSDMMCARPGWNYSIYGDKEYVDHVLRYYQVLNTGGTYPANGMQIPLYIQTEYRNIPYGTGSIADCGCGPTAFAMVASYLTGSTITPVDAVAWCGNSYYKAGKAPTGPISRRRLLISDAEASPRPRMPMRCCRRYQKAVRSSPPRVPDYSRPGGILSSLGG